MITKDRRARVLDTLPRLLALPEGPEVVVVDDASSDGTAAAVADAHPQVTVVRLPRSRGAAARNDGVRACAAPVVAFADDDSWWADGALATAAATFAAHPDLALIAGRVVVGPDGREDPTNAAMADSPLGDDGLPGPEVLGFVACGSLVRRSAFLAVGGFEPRLGLGGEESILAMDLRTAGHRSAYVPAVVAHHAPDAADPRPGRRRALARNELWTAWLRRRPAGAARITADVVRRAVGDRDVRRGLVLAVGGIPWVLRARAPISAGLERDVRAVEAAA